MSSIKISIVVPTIGRIQDLKELFSSIKNQKFSDCEYEVIVISQNHLPAVDKLLQSFEFRNFMYLQSQKRGVNVSRNLGIQNARGAVIYFLDDDCEIVNPNQFSFIVQQLDLNERLVGIGGPYLLSPGAGRIESAYHSIAMAWYDRHVLNGLYTDQLLGGNAAYTAQLLKTLKFDERIIFGGAEEELNYQIHARGLLMISEDGLAVRHHLRMSFFDLIRKAYLQGFWSGDRHARQISTGHLSDEDFLRNKPTQLSVLFLIAIYRFVFGYAFLLRGEREPFRALQIFIVYSYNKIIIKGFYERLLPYLIWKVLWPALVGTYVFVVWGVLWRASYPFRKLYYFATYQWQTRVRRSHVNN